MSLFTQHFLLFYYVLKKTNHQVLSSYTHTITHHIIAAIGLYLVDKNIVDKIQ